MSTTVKDGMVQDVVSVRPDDPLRAAVEIIMLQKIRHVPVVAGTGQLVGILTDRDVKRVLPSPLSPSVGDAETLLDTTTVDQVMTREPFTVTPSTPTSDAVQIMVNKKVGGLPVVENSQLVGIFTQIDALRMYLQTLGVS